LRFLLFLNLKHLGSSRQYWRDIILGVNDGLISTFLLVTGVAGGGLSSNDILLTAIAGALAGAVSMCAGEYVATKSQNEVMQGELALEKEHVMSFRDEEVNELRTLLELIGITDEQNEMREQLLMYYRVNPEALLKVMKTLEFGVVEDQVRSPILAGLFSCVLFVGGSIPSIVPFIFSGDRPYLGLMAATILTTTSLLVVGAIKTWATRGDCFVAAMENLIIAGCGGVLAYSVGAFFNQLLHDN
jgi:VIT1/CCC1 family predicted Fe2+/Mn2+ transporter